MEYKDFYKSNINFKGNSYVVGAIKMNDFRNFYDLDEVLNIISDQDDKEYKRLRKLIPKPYIKTFEVNGQKRKFIDRLAFSYLVKEVDDYDFCKYFESSEVQMLKDYPIETLCLILNKLIPKSGTVNQLSDKIKSIDSVQQDILHKMENENLSDKDMLELAYELKMLREHRRLNKNEYAILSTLKRFFDFHKVKQGDVTKFINEINKHKFNLGNKIYNKRANEEITEEWKLKLQKYMAD